MSDICNIHIIIEKSDGSVLTCERVFTEYQEPLLIETHQFVLPVYYEIHTIEGEQHWTNDAEHKYFDKPYFVDIVDDDGNEIERSFRTEAEAVAFIHSKCPKSIPDNLATLNGINDYCQEHDLNNLWYYHVVNVCNKCTPTAIRIIRKLIYRILHDIDIQLDNTFEDYESFTPI